jgi:peroxiredoxin
MRLDGLPVPQDDGAARRVPGSEVPSVRLDSSQGRVDIADICAGLGIVYVYPLTGRPGRPMPTDWSQIPGARGCTPESWGFRDSFSELSALGARVAGVSAQSLEDQIEFAERNEMPFPVISDPELRLREALGLPAFVVEGLVLYKRITFVAENRRIVKVFYPVFPAERNAQEVLDWVRARSSGLSRTTATG